MLHIKEMFNHCPFFPDELGYTSISVSCYRLNRNIPLLHLIFTSLCSTAKPSSLCLLNSNLALKSSKVYKSLEAREAGLSSAGGLDVWQGSEEEVSKTEYVGDFEKNVLESGKQLTLCGRGLAVRPPILTAIPFFS